MQVNLSELGNLSIQAVGFCQDAAGRLSLECAKKQLCPQFASYFINWAWVLICAYLLADMALPLIFRFIIPGFQIKPIPGLPFASDGDPARWQQSLITWIKDRIFFAVFIYLMWLIWLN